MVDAIGPMTPVEPREPTKQELTKEIARIDRSISDVLFFGGNLKLLLNSDPILKSRSKGIEIYADLERDSHVASVIRKRKSAVTSREWAVKAASDDATDAQIADTIKNALQRLRFDKLTKAALDAILKGYSPIEIIWAVVDGKEYGASGQLTMPVKFKKRDQRRFVADINGNWRLRTLEKPVEGEELPDRKFIVHSHGDVDESPYGRGVGASIFWPVFFKRQNLSFWLQFNDKFGAPTIKGTFPPGTLPAEKNNLRDSLEGVSRTAAILVPDGMVVELLETTKGTTDNFQRLAAYMDEEISKAVLGETMTTTAGENGGNRALGEVHNDVRLEFAKDDADEFSYTLNETLMRWIVELNWPGRMPPRVWRVFEEEEDVDKIAARDKTLKDLGYERTEESFAEVYGDGYVKVQPVEPSLDTGGLLPEFAEESGSGFLNKLAGLFKRRQPSDVLAAQRQRNRDIQDSISKGADGRSAEWDKLLGPRVDRLLKLADETGDLVAFRESLNEAIADVPDTELVDTIARATFASNLAGRLPRK